MEQIKLKASPREGRGKGPARRLRSAGQTPAIVYGGDGAPEAVAIDTRGFEFSLHHGMTSNSLVKLQIEGQGGEQFVVLREMTRDPVSQRLNHLDFYRVRLDQMVEYEIPVHAVGTSPGVKGGGILEHVTRTITVECLPTDVPEFFEVSIENLDFGQSIHVSDMKFPETVQVLSDPQTVLLSVVAPKVVEETTPVEGAEGEAIAAGEGEEPKEPEVISKGKKDEGEEA
jgi:large subunit ribosomal protein L25